MPKKTTIDDASYSIRPPGRPRKSAAPAEESAGVQANAEGESLRFEMRLPPGMVADLELMRKNTGQTYANYIRSVVIRALKEDKTKWQGAEDD